MTDSADALYLVDVDRATELDLKFYQTQSLAVLCEDNIPPECIAAVITIDGNMLYKNDYLYDIAPGDRPANVAVGHDLARTTLHVKIKRELREGG